MRTKEEIRLIANEIHENVKKAIFMDDVRRASTKLKKIWKTQPNIIPVASSVMCYEVADAISKMVDRNPERYKKLLKQYENGS